MSLSTTTILLLIGFGLGGGASVAAGQSTSVRPEGTRPAYTRETGAARAQIDLKYEEHIRVSSMVGQQFSAQVVTTLKMVDPEGIETVRTSRDLLARDAMGRWYRESHMHPATGRGPSREVTAQVWDPVASTFINLDMTGRLALVSRDENPAIVHALHTRGRLRKRASQTEMYGGNESVVFTDLGERTIEGVRVWGDKVTSTFDPEVMGSSQPLTVVREVWHSDELGVDMEIHEVNPITGDRTIRLEALDRNSPPESLFSVPAGFSERITQKR